MLLKLLKFLVKIIGGNLGRLSMVSFLSNMKSNMETPKMLFLKILSEDLDLSREKWKISIRNLEKYYPYSGVWTASSSTNSAQSQEYI